MTKKEIEMRCKGLARAETIFTKNTIILYQKTIPIKSNRLYNEMKKELK